MVTWRYSLHLILHAKEKRIKLRVCQFPKSTLSLAFRAVRCHTIRVKQTHSMQLSNSVCTVDFFPEAFIAESCEIKGMKVVVKRFIKRVTFNVNGQKSYSTVTALTARNEWSERIASGATVTDYHTDKMPRSEYAPMACVG